MGQMKSKPNLATWYEDHWFWLHWGKQHLADCNTLPGENGVLEGVIQLNEEYEYSPSSCQTTCSYFEELGQLLVTWPNTTPVNPMDRREPELDFITFYKPSLQIESNAFRKLKETANMFNSYFRFSPHQPSRFDYQINTTLAWSESALFLIYYIL